MSKVTEYLDQIFCNFPQKPEILAYKENLNAQMEVVFKAECASGKTEEEALGVAVASAPDYEAIYETLGIEQASRECDPVWYRAQVKLMTFWYALAIALFVVSPFGMVGLSIWKHTHNLVAGLAVLFFSVGIGIGILIYAKREKKLLREMKPTSEPKPASAWALVLGILFCIIAPVGFVFSLQVLEGKVLSRECASSLIDLAIGVMFIVWYSQRKRWFSR